MPIQGYGVWRCTPIAWDPKKTPDHGHITFTDESGGSFDSAVNVTSQSQDTRLVYWFVRDFDKTHPLAAQLAALSGGFHAVPHQPNGLALDFLRSDLVVLKEGTILSHDGSSNDIMDYITPIVQQAVDAKATMFLFGQQYSGHDGIHDIHMNQGSSEAIFTKDDGTWQDGGIIISFPDGHWEAIFLAFAAEASKTDDNGLPAGPTFAELLAQPSGGQDAAPDSMSGAMAIEAARVGPEQPQEQTPSGAGGTVFLRNQTTTPVSLAGWSIENGAGQQQKLGQDASVSGLSKQAFHVPDSPLTSAGGDIVLKNAQGQAVQKVNFSREQANREGKFVYFGQRAQQHRRQ